MLYQQNEQPKFDLFTCCFAKNKIRGETSKTWVVFFWETLKKKNDNTADAERAKRETETDAQMQGEADRVCARWVREQTGKARWADWSGLWANTKQGGGLSQIKMLKVEIITSAESRKRPPPPSTRRRTGRWSRTVKKGVVGFSGI